MATPAWIGATPAQPQLAAQVNEFLGTHAAQIIYTGVSLGGQTTLGSGSASTFGQYIAQTFTPGTSQTPGRFTFSMSVTGTPGLLTVAIHTDSAGAPSSTVLAATVVPCQYVPGTQTVVSIPLPCTLAASTPYWLVFNAVSDIANFYSLFKSNQATGVSTSVNGTTWTAQAYGIYYARFDQSPVPPLVHTWEDSGARWTALTENASNQPTSLKEYTVAQGTGQYVYSSRSMSYSSGDMVAIT